MIEDAIILLDDISPGDFLFPFGQISSIAHLRTGIFTIIERWENFFPGCVLLASKENESSADKNVFRFPANVIPSHDYLLRLASVKTWSDEDKIPQGKTITYPWQLSQYNAWAIEEDFKIFGKKKSRLPEGVRIRGTHDVFIEDGISIENVFINTTNGPVYIGKDVEIMEGTMIRGPVAVCAGSLVKMGARIYGGTTIGKNCVAAGEIKNSILMDFSNKAHDGYLGDSVIGSWCNLGAGTSNSNLKNTAGDIKMWVAAKNEYVSAGNKCGLIMGDFSRSAVNTSFNTGTITGVSCNIFSPGFPPTFLENFSWGNEKYQLEKAISHIRNWKELKGEKLYEEEIETIRKLYK